MQLPKRQNRKSGSEVIPSAVRCSAVQEVEKIARRGRVWRNAMQGQRTNKQMKQGWAVVRFVIPCGRCAVGKKKEGGDGPTVQGTGRGRPSTGHFSAWHSVTVLRFAFCVLSPAVVCCDVVHRGVMFQDEREREKVGCTYTCGHS